ncbi:tyrosine-type recombinase/integrase [Methylopila sp. 73B]|uniref:tyrosine-type recombinase/integrase n=1 Tax=Methylopila sp. 73B TaxID=1120792 RepID=UPI00035DDE9A|nr:tyrosine-type recombinase/integrase [Methylopila sp. 73B]
MKRRRLPRYVSEFKDRHGKMRVRFRRTGQEAYYFKSIPWTPEFQTEYQACLDRMAAPKIEPGASRTKPGTLDDLIVRYYRDALFTGLAASSKRNVRSRLEAFRLKHGAKPVAGLERHHIKAIIGGMSDRPSAANNLLKLLKTLLTFAVDERMRRDNPAIGIRGFRIKNDGLHTWSEEEIAQFEARHPIGSKARLAMALMLYTGQRRSDVVRMGWQHVSRGGIKVRQQKTGESLDIPLHAELERVIAGTPRENLTFLVTEYGKPFSNAGFGNWFRDRCDEAGLPQCSAHGLRKAIARRLAEGGSTNQQIKAVTGHRTESEVSRYTRAAEQKMLAGQAMKRLPKRETGTNLANHPEEGSQNED